VIVGAGPYGLALAHVLSQAGIETTTIGTPLGSWRGEMPRGMLLKSEGHASSIITSDAGLTLRSYCAEVGAEYQDIGLPVPLEVFASYGEWFQERAVPEVRPELVERITRGPQGFDVALQTGETVPAGRVVVATGIGRFAHIPPELRDAPGSTVSHTSRLRDPGVFAGRRVAVVGAGQSALESAALIREAGGEPIVLARRRALVWNSEPDPGPVARRGRLRRPWSPLGPGWPLFVYSHLAAGYPALPETIRRTRARSTLGPAGGWWLHPRIEGLVEVRCGTRILGWQAKGEGLQLELAGPDGGSTLDVDHVLCGTGYRVDLGRLELLDPTVREQVLTSHGAPILSRTLESTVPGLHFTGAMAMDTFGPLMRFVCGAEFAARRFHDSLMGRALFKSRRATRGSASRRVPADRARSAA
jgi:hypothetical protein